jgi:hypothetical protein
MEIVDNTAVRFTLPTDLVPSVINNIEKSELVETKGISQKFWFIGV